MIRAYSIIIMLAIAAGGWALNYCETAFGAQAIIAVEGKISAIDTFKSTVTIKSLAVYPIITYKENLLFVAPNSKIMKSGNVLSIFDLTMGCPVSAKYIEESVAPNTLVSMTVTK